ncbi:hypothetical protein IAD21_05730 [Abditibacteriota bacterium]|nr:hypothetical protein IAD21_05730 [Abditibacteriota bacterium]
MKKVISQLKYGYDVLKSFLMLDLNSSTIKDGDFPIILMVLDYHTRLSTQQLPLGSTM